ncbi:MAG: GH3 auxin-responsive promoter family protein [Bacteroidetes bacterium]|nr:GH3 auxin-responsive promoter family protein [Bacteroidota bacterium]
MALLNSIASWIMKKRMHQIDLFMKYPHDVQNEWQQKLVRSARHTEFGKKHHFSSIQSYQQFKEQIPLQDYESLKPLIERVRSGEQNILWNTEIKWFAKSSGTTDKSKFLPVSKESLNENHYNGGRDMVTLHCVNNPDTQLFTGKNVALGGSHQTHLTGNYESYYGDVSAIVMQNLPAWAEYFRVPDLEIALLENWDEKLDKMAEAMLQENVTSIAGVPSWMLVLMRRILEQKNTHHINEIWPHLEVYFHGGVSLTPYKNQFKKMFAGSPTKYMQIYNASEGFFGLQDLPESDEMLLMLDYGIFYEFIAQEDIDKPNPTALHISQVDTQTVYELVITTNAGLWRYRLGDTIRFTSLNPYRFIITGRTKHYINVFGEELMIHNAEQALKIACEKTHAQINEYTVAPFFTQENKGKHQWLIEFAQEPNNIGFFSATLDKSLKSINSDYEAKRYHNYVIEQPEVLSLPKNTFYRWLSDKNKLGGQYKVPRLQNNRTIAEEILLLIPKK